MSRSKEILAAGIVQDICFRSWYFRDLYLQKLDERGINYQLVYSQERDYGSVMIRIIKPYNGSELIQL